MPVAHLSDHVLELVRHEHPIIVERVQELREQSQRLHSIVERVDQELADASRQLRGIEELIGLAPQLSLDAHNGELRGRRLREIAVEVLRQGRDPGAEIHYKQWYDLVTATGVRVAGKDPLATFLTQVAKAPGVESVRPRSGLYRLTA